MKKIFALVLTLLVVTSLFYVTAFAADDQSVIKVQYDSETKAFDNFEDGWNFAMDQANDGKEASRMFFMIYRIPFELF